ncbi:Ohr family peroxiredoxin [Allopusillimonas soli]|uniref:Ohr family peroxiredoxin n=1 Tax=Allopusillimonas soli TaxID=659016 RepID=A0A853FF03_9BURK|nr:Ohr family peroxiredoxin [Allopusillimonas soli]NYT37400.1 Ohr family peroxiredoxin [Allopusillimonas soli]TEA74618.1 Ohr family peroxiredoxin [Allopusillimonas soli]
MTPLQPPPLTLLEKYRGRDTQTLYSATVTVTGGDAGHGRASGVARSDDGNLDVSLRLPHELGGPGGGTNPEQLFAAGYAACFHGALSLLAARARLPIPGSAVQVTIDFCRDPVDGLFVLKAKTRVRLPGLDRPLAEELVRNTERFCPYAKMARQGIENIVVLDVSDETDSPMDGNRADEGT